MKNTASLTGLLALTLLVAAVAGSITFPMAIYLPDKKSKQKNKT
ncbi:MAG TPA: hypothetical protein PK239_15440 [Chitinophagales bacterium]|nr:hypothetical protein [Chitinophagales bacterium]